MTEQEKRTVLERYQKLDQEINWNLERLAEWKAFSTRTTARYTAASDRSGIHLDRIQLSYDKIETLTRRINQDIDRLVALRQTLEEVIAKIPDPTARILLWERYIGGKTNEQIANLLHYCTKQVMRIHLKALTELELPEELLEFL